VRKIRRALNDDAESSRCIVTIPGKSCRFVEPVRIPNGEATTSGNGEEAINRQSALASASDENPFDPSATLTFSLPIKISAKLVVPDASQLR
jgi:DNA-binding winged helix-turn-helix (wHTH) protein